MDILNNFWFKREENGKIHLHTFGLEIQNNCVIFICLDVFIINCRY